MRTVPLNDTHISSGAKMCPFAGWQMPIEYPTGNVAEHTAVRTAAGIFDVSHMGKVKVVGPGAVEFLNGVLANDLNRISAGQAQYSLLCSDTGGVIDDLIVYRVSDDEVRIVPNASNSAEVVEILRSLASDEVVVQDLQTEQGILAVQGPNSAQIISALGLPAEMDYMAFAIAQWQGHELTVCRTGYTGEHGYELIAPNEILVPLWDALLEHGSSLGLIPCGLGARDTLRTEMGYPLHGQDISAEITAVTAKLGWAIGWTKPNFLGKELLDAEKADGSPRTLFGLRALDRGIPRPHMKVLNGDVEVGETTSGTFSPTLQQGIALALLDAGTQVGDELTIDVRGRALRVEVVKPPFVPSHVK
jgi:aminomethyltransferase